MSEMVSKPRKTISIDEDTHERLFKHGKYGDSMDTIINRVLDGYEKVNKQH